MPLYEFQCLTCGEIKELVQKWDNTATPLCKCSGETVRIMSPCQFYFVGGAPSSKERVTSFEKFMED